MPENNINPKIKNDVLSRDNFTCQKCGFRELNGNEMEIHYIKMRVDGGDEDLQNLITLCSICHHFAPDDENKFKKYLAEKIDGTILNTFRSSQKSISKRTKSGMAKKINNGEFVSRAALGYKIQDKKLVPADDSYLVQEIFQTFLNQPMSLTQLGKRYNLSVNGLKKVLTNETYLGKIKFSHETSQGQHQALVSEQLFKQVQDRLKSLGITEIKK